MPIFDYSCEYRRGAEACLAHAFQDHICSILYLFDTLAPSEALEEGIAEEIEKTVHKYLNVPQSPLELKGALALEYLLTALEAPLGTAFH